MAWSKKEPREFRPKGALALDPKAFGLMFALAEEPAVDVVEGVARITVRGPLLHHADSWGCFDSYDGIKARVAEAIEKKPSSVVLVIDSPGGLVSGVFETARAIRSMCDAAGVALFAYVDGAAQSAAYALAAAARHIASPETGNVGSVGVVAEMVDVSAADARNGIAFKIITSGARKADGNIHVPISDGAAAATQKQVDYLAQIFFKHVAAFRNGMSVEQVRALEAGTFIGNDALAQGLVDEVATLDDLMTTAATGSVPAKDGSAQAANGEKKMSKLYEDAIAGLRKAAESDDAEEAKKAKRMLQAELAEDSDGDSDKPEPKKEDAKADDSDGDGSDEPKKEDAKAEGDAPAMPPKKDEDAKAMAARAIAKVESFEAAQAKAAEVSERRELLATRPDFSQEVLATLANASIETVRGAVKTWPRGPARKPAAAISAIGTRGDGQGDGEASHLPPAEKLALDRAMGLVDEKPGVRADGNRLILGEFMPVKTDDKGAR